MMDNMDKKIQEHINYKIEHSKKFDSMIKDTINMINNDDIKQEEYKTGSKFLKMVASFIIFVFSTALVGIGGISAYSALGGEIQGKPALRWIGDIFSDSYVDYVEPVEGKNIAFDETSVELVSTMCSEGFTVLEFDVKLSEKDKQHLRIGEHIFTGEDLERRIANEQRLLKQCEDYSNEILSLENGMAEDYNIEKIRERTNKEIEFYKNAVNTGIALYFNTEPSYIDEQGEFGGDKKSYGSSLVGNRIMYIDGEETWCMHASQTVERKSDYQYKVYQTYFLSEKEIQDKTEFTLNLNNVVIINDYNEGSFLNTLVNERFIETGGNIEVKLSKEKILKDSKNIEPPQNEINCKRLNQKIDKVSVNPVQTVIKFTTILNNVSVHTIAGYGRFEEDSVSFQTFNIYDTQGNKIESDTLQTNRVITYSNGTKEEYWPGWVGEWDSKFKNATFEDTGYVVLQTNEDLDKIILKPVLEIPDVENHTLVEVESDECFEINLK